MQIFLALLAFALPAKSAPVSLESALGSYIGCGDFSAFGQRKMVFHFVQIPSGTEPTERALAGSFKWANEQGLFNHSSFSAVFFNEGKFNAETGRLFLRTQFLPKGGDVGAIVNTVLAEVQPDGSLIGTYATNTLQADGFLLQGRWTARKLLPGESPNQSKSCD